MTFIIAFRVLDFFFKLFSQVCFVFDFVFFNVDSADFFRYYLSKWRIGTYTHSP